MDRPTLSHASRGAAPHRDAGRFARLIMLLLALGFGVAACGGNLTAGGLSEAEVTVSGDAPDASPAASRVWSTVNQEEDDDDDAEGQLEATFNLYLVDDLGAAVRLSDDDIDIRLDVEGIEEVEVTPRAVPAGRYNRFRIIFSELEVQVDAGLIIDGREVTGPIDIEFEGDSLSVERPLPLDLDAGERVEILVDLNSQTWLRAVDPDIQSVADEIVANAIDIRVIR